MRTCTKCGETAEDASFYHYANGKPMAQCKACIKARVRNHRNDNIERIREYDRERAGLPHRVELRRKIFERYKVEQPDRRAAHIAVGNAIRDKRLHKQPCAFCGQADDVEAHHHDYAKPLDVTWLCKPCHRRFHALERMATYREDAA
jgi:hypothetical protein